MEFGPYEKSVLRWHVSQTPEGSSLILDASTQPSVGNTIYRGDPPPPVLPQVLTTIVANQIGNIRDGPFHQEVSILQRILPTCP